MLLRSSSNINFVDVNGMASVPKCISSVPLPRVLFQAKKKLYFPSYLYIISLGQFQCHITRMGIDMNTILIIIREADRKT